MLQQRAKLAIKHGLAAGEARCLGGLRGGVGKRIAQCFGTEQVAFLRSGPGVAMEAAQVASPGGMNLYNRPKLAACLLRH